MAISYEFDAGTQAILKKFQPLSRGPLSDTEIADLDERLRQADASGAIEGQPLEEEDYAFSQALTRLNLSEDDRTQCLREHCLYVLARDQG